VVSKELRELENQLKAAYMNKERVAQIAEREAERHDYVTREVTEQRVLAEQRKQAEEAMKQREVERVAANQRYQEQLQLQLQVYNSWQLVPCCISNFFGKLCRINCLRSYA